MEVAALLAREDVFLRVVLHKDGNPGHGDGERGLETEAELVGLAEIWRDSQLSV